MGVAVVVVVRNESDDAVLAGLYRIVALGLEGQEAWIVLNCLRNSVVIDVKEADIAEDACLAISLTDAAHDSNLRRVQSGHGAEPFRDESSVDEVDALPLRDLTNRKIGIGKLFHADQRLSVRQTTKDVHATVMAASSSAHSSLSKIRQDFPLVVRNIESLAAPDKVVILLTADCKNVSFIVGSNGKVVSGFVHRGLLIRLKGASIVEDCTAGLRFTIDLEEPVSDLDGLPASRILGLRVASDNFLAVSCRIHLDNLAFMREEEIAMLSRLDG